MLILFQRLRSQGRLYAQDCSIRRLHNGGVVQGESWITQDLRWHLLPVYFCVCTSFDYCSHFSRLVCARLQSPLLFFSASLLRSAYLGADACPTTPGARPLEHTQLLLLYVSSAAVLLLCSVLWWRIPVTYPAIVTASQTKWLAYRKPVLLSHASVTLCSSQWGNRDLWWSRSRQCCWSLLELTEPRLALQIGDLDGKYGVLRWACGIPNKHSMLNSHL